MRLENYSIARKLRMKFEPSKPSEPRPPWAAHHPGRLGGRTNQNNTGG